jgi:YVTN family beta-propeller protein
MFRYGLALPLLVACTANSEEVRPRATDIFFPTGAAIAPTERYLFITNANSELRYDSGSVDVIDLDVVDQVAQAWVDRDASYAPPGGCRVDTEQRETLNCDDGGDPAPAFILPDAGVRIGNFSSALAIQALTPDLSQLRLFAAVRGDPSVTYADWDGTRLECSAETAFPLCDDGHRLNHYRDDVETTIPDEPFQVFTDSVSGFAAITHLTSGSVTLVDSPSDPASVPRVTDIITGLFNANADGARGAAGIAGRSPGGPNPDLLYVTSRTEDRIQMLTVTQSAAGAIFVPSNFFFLDSVGGNNGSSADTRYAAFGENGDRLYLVNRQPPSLQVYDTELDATGFPTNRFVAGTDLCREASNMAVADVGDGTKAYVTCFRDGEVYVIDTAPDPEVEAIVTVGRGPFGIAVSAVRQKLYVTNFLEDTVAVIELDPTSEHRFQVVLRIGVRRS